MAAVKQAVQAMVTEKRAISADEAKAAMQDLFAGTASQAQTGAFLTSLQVSPHAHLHRLNCPPCSLGRDARIVCREWLLQRYGIGRARCPQLAIYALACACANDQKQPLDPELLKVCAETMVSFANSCKVETPLETMDIVGTVSYTHLTLPTKA